MSEALITAWFATHPFWRTEAVSVVAALTPMIAHDYLTFKNAQAADPDGLSITFDPFIALRKYALAVVIGVLPPIGVVIYRVLGL